MRAIAVSILTLAFAVSLAGKRITGAPTADTKDAVMFFHIVAVFLIIFGY